MIEKLSNGSPFEMPYTDSDKHAAISCRHRLQRPQPQSRPNVWNRSGS